MSQDISPDQPRSLDNSTGKTAKGLPLASVSRAQSNSIWGYYRQAVVNGARGHVLEIGVGPWSNLARYSPDIESLTGIEPDARSIKQARKRVEHVEQAGRNVDLRLGSVEALPFPDASFDTVVATFVWCSVGDVSAGLCEIKRVLKPGGELRFLEHVRSRSPRAAHLQDLVTPLYCHLVGNCHPNRDTEQALRAADFEIIECWHINSDRLVPSPTIAGRALR
jgi:ubiquinone/menaquinone biosynthesis C-methylase UbiE